MSNNPKIKHGFFNAFYSFNLFDNNNKLDKNRYIKVLEALKDSNLIISAEKANKEVFFMENFEDLIRERKREYRSFNMRGENPPPYLNQSITKIAEKPTIYFRATDRGVSLQLEDDLIDNLEDSQLYYLEQLVEVYSAEERYTGIPSKEYKNRFLLFPPLINDCHQNSYHPGIYLTIFKHGYAVLWISFELKDIEFDEIGLNGWGLKIKNALFPELMISNNQSFQYKIKDNCNDINSVLREYAKFIYHAVNQENPKIEGQFFYHLVLSEFAYMLDKYTDNKTSPKFNEAIYKLLSAPLPDYLLRTPNEIQKFLDEKYRSVSMFLRIYANNNRTISVYTKEQGKAIKDQVEEDIDLNDNEALNFLFQGISIGGIINSIESLLLKKEAIQKLTVFELNESTSLNKLINLLIQENTNYSVEFTKYFYTYGTLREELKFLENSCEDFIQSKLMHERMERIEKVITLKKERYITNFTAVGPILTIILTLFLSFPTLKNIFQELEKEKLFLPTYFILNLLIIFYFLYLTRNALMEFKNDLLNNLLPIIKDTYIKSLYVFNLWCINTVLLLNTEYKEAFKIIFLKSKISDIK
ncbi:hypothetical protein [Psychrobacillus sp. NPDC096623]|uniref:hypothetical protein n=1 Tax=Psychrobacillus sp. NPDC096623 TaxID=3364492 RepID=UPI003813419E